MADCPVSVDGRILVYKGHVVSGGDVAHPLLSFLVAGGGSHTLGFQWELGVFLEPFPAWCAIFIWDDALTGASPHGPDGYG